MKFKTLKRIEKICIAGILVLSIFASICTIMFVVNKNNNYVENSKFNTHQLQNETKEKTNNELDVKKNIFPIGCRINEQIPDVSFIKEDGTKLNIADLKGKTVILTFWASWCKHCANEMQHSQEFFNVLKKYENVEFVLVNKLDGVKETKEQALNYLKQNNIPFSTLFDENLASYNKLGIKIVPTTLIINKEGIIKSLNAGEIEDAGKLEALIQNTLKENSYSLEKFIKSNLTNDKGGIMTSYLKEKDKNPTGDDVLSESQGIILEYAVIKNDKELFQRTLEYINKYMKEDELAAWVIQNGKSNRVNAILDDLRIYKGMEKAPEIFGDFSEKLKIYRDNIYKYNVNRNNLVDSYDFKYKTKADRITLCYADLKTLNNMALSDTRFNDIYENSLKIVQEGYISDIFPFYYNYYNYKTKNYEKSEINTSEGMLTLLHLAEIKQLPNSTVQWLKDTISNKRILGRYNVDGSVVQGYEYESTAVYAIAALIGKEINDNELVNLAISNMERMRINNVNSKFNGAFGNEDGTGIYSFDQCMALIAYGKLEERNEK